MEIDIKQVLLQVLNFSILVFLLKKYLYKPVLDVLKTREDKINEGMTAAAKSLQDQEDSAKKTKSALTKAHREASLIAKDATADAKKQATAIIAAAKRDAKAEVAKAEKKATAQLEEKEKALNAQVGGLVVETTRSVLADLLSAKDVERITQATIKKLG